MASASKVVLITGANTGIGYETVRSLSSSPQAYTILLGGRSIDKANKAAETARAEFPKSASTIQTVQIDIEDDDSINALYDDIESKFGKLDILVNNAGAFIYNILHFILHSVAHRLTIDFRRAV